MNWTEDIIVFYRNLPTFNPQMVFKNKKPTKHLYSKVMEEESGVFGKCGYQEGYVSDNGGYVYPKSVLDFNNSHGFTNKEKYKHPTQKPVDLIRYLIRTYTNPGDIVLDNCLGSGTTAIAAMREGRDYIGYEKDEQFFEMCHRRIADEKELMAAQADPLY